MFIGRLMYVPLLACIPFGLWLLFEPKWLNWVEWIPSDIRALIAVLASVAFLAVHILNLRLIVLLERAVVRSAGLTCKYCGYDVRACHENRCPECGEEFDRHDLMRYWHKQFWPKREVPPWMEPKPPETG